MRSRTTEQQREHELVEARRRDEAVRDGDHPLYDTLEERFDYDLPRSFRRGRRG